MPQPSWSKTDYNCVSRDFAGVYAMLKRQQVRAKLAAAQAKIATLVSDGPRGVVLREEIKTHVLEMIRQNSDEVARRNALASLIASYRKARADERQNRGAVGDAKSHGAIRGIGSIYFRFDLKAFEDDFAAALKAEVESDPVQAELDQLTKSVERLRTEDRKWSADAIAAMFEGGVPVSWRTFQSADRSPEEFAELVFGTFLSEYRTRAPLFAEPVTISGVALRCLPTSRRENWRTLYDHLELGSLPKRVNGFEAIVLTGLEDDVTIPAELPGKFKGGKK